MGVYHEAKLICGAKIEDFGKINLKNLKKHDPNFNQTPIDDEYCNKDNILTIKDYKNSDRWHYTDNPVKDEYYYESLINFWLKNNYPSFSIMANSPWYDCDVKYKTFCLTRIWKDEMSLKELREFDFEEEKFKELYKILTGEIVEPKLIPVIFVN